jgi:hypothetical protein
MIYLLTLLEQNSDIEPLLKSARVANIVAGMLRKGLITNQNKITLLGKEILKFTDTVDYSPLVKKKTKGLTFDDWWAIYPKTDGFTHKRRTFPLTRNLIAGKAKAIGYWDKIMNAGEYTALEIIDATKFDVLQRKEMSVKQGKNNLTFMQNSATYLYNDSFEAFVSIIRGGGEVESGPSKGREIDI